jgi:hypothetical protein
MRRMLIAVAVVIGCLSAASAADQCDAAYLNFMERLNYRAERLPAHQLAVLHRQAIRIFDACDMGHLTNAEERFRNLDAG